MMWHDAGWFGMGLGLHWLWGLLIWGLIIWAAVQLIRQVIPVRASTGDAAIATLRDRYARGELSKDEFERMRMDLAN